MYIATTPSLSSAFKTLTLVLFFEQVRIPRPKLGKAAIRIRNPVGGATNVWVIANVIPKPTWYCL